MCMSTPLARKYLPHGCSLRENKRHKDYRQLLGVVHHEYEAEVEHAAGCRMLMCCALSIMIAVLLVYNFQWLQLLRRKEGVLGGM